MRYYNSISPMQTWIFNTYFIFTSYIWLKMFLHLAGPTILYVLNNFYNNQVTFRILLDFLCSHGWVNKLCQIHVITNSWLIIIWVGWRETIHEIYITIPGLKIRGVQQSMTADLYVLTVENLLFVIKVTAH